MATETDRRPGDGGLTNPVTAFLRWTETLSESAFAYLLLVPALLILTVIALYPLVRTFSMSLYADAVRGSAQLGPFVGLENYVALFQGEKNFALPSRFLPVFSAEFPFVHNVLNSAVGVTLVFAVVSVAFETVIGFGQALVLDQEFTGRRWVRVAVIIPWAVPIVIQGMIFYLLFQPNIGFLIGTAKNPALLNQIGLVGTTPLANTGDSLLLIIVADIWKTSAFMALIILAGLQSIDRSLYDVARVSGATRWQQFKYITLPLVLPSVLVAMLFRTIAAMRVFGIIPTMAGCGTVPSLSCTVVTTFDSRLYGTSATLAFVTAALIAVVVSVYIFKFADAEGGGL